MSSRARRLASKLGGSFKRTARTPSSDGSLDSPASPVPGPGALTPSRQAIPPGIAITHKEKYDVAGPVEAPIAPRGSRPKVPAHEVGHACGNRHVLLLRLILPMSR